MLAILMLMENQGVSWSIDQPQDHGWFGGTENAKAHEPPRRKMPPTTVGKLERGARGADSQPVEASAGNRCLSAARPAGTPERARDAA
jgi:hypothetical protein